MADKIIKSGKIVKPSVKSKTQKAISKNEVKIKEADSAAENIREMPSVTNESQFLKKKTVIPILAIVVLVVLLYLGRGLFIAASVNGEPISRLSVISELEKRAGKTVMSSLVTKTLILQEAKKKNITVSNDEVNSEIKKIEGNLTRQGQSLDQILIMQGMTKEDFTEQVMLQKLVEKMLSINVSDTEVNKYIESNKESLSAGNENIKPEDLKASAREQVKQQKFNDKFQAWMQDLQKNAKIDYLVNY